ncbi:restriction endonuclease subunit S [Aeromonas hydrophila]|uniref:restriction endonuclease subunit S n=1 Tax=Aeromonas hydrophila TaxID=644 RepID=UPI00385B81A2
MTEQMMQETAGKAIPAGYKQTEVGVIPEDWDVKSVYALANNQKALFDDGDWIEAEHITDKGVRLIQTGNIGIGSFIEKDVKKYVYEKSFESLRCKELHIGDLLICRLAEPAGRACILPYIGETKVITSVDVTIFKPERHIANRDFLVQYFSSIEWFKSVQEQVGGTTHKRISRGALGQLLMPYPSLDEQTAIANVLSDSDALIDALEQLIAKKQAIKSATMQQLLTGRTRLPAFALRPNGTPKGYKPSELGEIPEDWEVTYLLDVATLIHGKAHEPYVTEAGKYIVINSKFVSTGGEVRKYCSQNDCAARNGDVLMVLSDLPNGKALAKCFYADQNNVYAVNQRVCIFRTNIIDPKYLYLVLNRHKYFLALDDGVTQTHILNGDIANCQLYAPVNKAEQTAIATILSDMDNELQALTQKLDKARALKQGMMQQLLTGKIRLPLTAGA